MNFQTELDTLIRARVPLIFVISREEERVLRELAALSTAKKRALFAWDLAEGFQEVDAHGRTDALQKGTRATVQPILALEAIQAADGNATYILKDFHDCWTQPAVKRKLRSVAQRLKFTKKTIVVLSPVSALPEELRDLADVVEFTVPGEEGLGEVLDSLLKLSGTNLELASDTRTTLVQAAAGLSADQALRVFAKALVSGGTLADSDAGLIMREKRQLVRESSALEFVTAFNDPSDVGGLTVLKDWLASRQTALTPEAKAYGLPAPKGIALVGIPGTGKTLCAKMIAGMWKLPLLRFDVGAVFGSYIGQSEEQMRRALKLAEAVSPCVLWIDEVEKALSHGGNDSGTSTRVFGTLLTWMQEKTAPCFLVATANDISKLPPELFRRGRFDDIFFLDLPNFEERQEIFSVHLAKRKRSASNFDLALLATSAEGYVGSEIEQAIIDAMFIGFGAQREFTTDDVRAALDAMVPMSVSQRERIAGLRAWLHEGRARSASTTVLSDNPVSDGS